MQQQSKFTNRFSSNRPRRPTYRTPAPAKAARPPLKATRLPIAPAPRVGLNMFRAVLVCLLLVGGFVYIGGHRQRVHANVVTPKVAEVSTARLSQLNTTISGLINSAPNDTISVLATDVSTGQSVSYGSTASFTAASTAKMLSAVYFLHQVETGQESLTENLEGSNAQDLLKQMIVNSDDTAWQIINDELTHAGLANYSASLGFTGYNISLNTLPASDIQLLMTKFYAGQLLNNSDTSLLLSYMAQANYREYIVAAVPAGDSVYHKAGLVDDEIHDTAIIKKGSHALVVTIFTDGNGTYDTAARTTLIHEITSQLTAAFLP